ncbi:MAG: vitamin K epoxide reductase family protein [Candidatus Methylomirabilales bacterium]
MRTRPNGPLFGLALIGMGLTGYLTVIAWNGEGAAWCPAGGGCDVVLRSPWSRLLGQPISFWGFLTYLSLAGLAFLKRIDLRWKLAWIVSLVGVLYSAYLTTVSIAKLKVTCPYCLTSAALMVAIFVTVLAQRPRTIPRGFWSTWLPLTFAGALLLVGALHLYYTVGWGQVRGEENPQVRALAEHLVKVGAQFYGAFWCPHCQEQKALFGASAHRLPYIECSPQGRRGPQASICQAMHIQSYPTWIINGRRYEGLLTLKELAEASGFHGEFSRGE